MPARTATPAAEAARQPPQEAQAAAVVNAPIIEVEKADAPELIDDADEGHIIAGQTDSPHRTSD
jgi:hypothetical protein